VDGEFSEEEIFPDRITGARHFFTEKIYGKVPEHPPKIFLKTIEEGPVIDQKSGLQKGYRKQLEVTLSRAGKSVLVKVLINAPSNDRAYPVLVSPNIYGNHSVTDDPNVFPSEAYSIVGERKPIQFQEEHRGYKQDRFNMDAIVASGKYAALTFSYHDIVPDTPVSGDTAGYALYPELQTTKHAPGAIAMWAWGMSQIGHAASLDPLIDGDRMAVMGFSRLGKAVHVALAERNHPWKAGISVASGKGGAASLKVGEGEPTIFMAHTYHHWFHRRFRTYAALVGKVLFGQKYLLAESNVPTLVSVDVNDWWSAVRQQRRTVDSANKMKTKRGQKPIFEFITHKAGGHTVSPDWNQYLNFLDRNLL
jgi:hypothetical protein